MALAVTSAPFQQVNMPALDLRRYLGAFSSEGVATGMIVSQRGAGANMSVDISSGFALVQGDSITNQGLYYAYNDATFNLTGFTAANATNPRIDRVALRVRDAFHGDAANDLAFIILTGTATAGATLSNLSGAASVPASHLLLANILIPANATTITTANIDASARQRAGGSGSEIVYVEQLTNVNANNVTNTVVVGASVAFDGATKVQVEFYCPLVEPPQIAGDDIIIKVFDGSAYRNSWRISCPATNVAGNSGFTGVYFKSPQFTPTAGLKSIAIAAQGSSASNWLFISPQSGYDAIWMRVVRA